MLCSLFIQGGKKCYVMFNIFNVQLFIQGGKKCYVMFIQGGNIFNVQLFIQGGKIPIRYGQHLKQYPIENSHLPRMSGVTVS